MGNAAAAGAVGPGSRAASKQQKQQQQQQSRSALASSASKRGAGASGEAQAAQAPQLDKDVGHLAAASAAIAGKMPQGECVLLMRTAALSPLILARQPSSVLPAPPACSPDKSAKDVPSTVKVLGGRIRARGTQQKAGEINVKETTKTPRPCRGGGGLSSRSSNSRAVQPGADVKATAATKATLATAAKRIKSMECDFAPPSLRSEVCMHAAMLC